jgi:ABC-type nitrate/sulfonate/bicarbonate transport system substrate-binding protein
MTLAAQSGQHPITIMVFPGMHNLPLFAAQAKGFFAKRELKVDIKFAPSGAELRNGLADGRHQIAHGAIDQAIAMAEIAKADIAVIMGGDNGFNRLFVQPDIKVIADLRGRTVIVDDTDTAYTLQMVHVLRQNGLNPGDYGMRIEGATFRRLEVMLHDKTAAATTLNPPFSLRAAMAGLRDMGEMVKLMGPYQGQTGFVMRAWARANPDAVVRYIQAVVESLRWVLDPANRAEATALLVEGLKLTPEIAAHTYEIASDPDGGLTKDAKLDFEGIKNVLGLRAELQGGPGGTLPPSEKYIDISYYDRALAGIGP